MLENYCPQVALLKIGTNNPDSRCGTLQQAVGRRLVSHNIVLEGAVGGVLLPLLHKLRNEREGSARAGRPWGLEIRSQSTILGEL